MQLAADGARACCLISAKSARPHPWAGLRSLKEMSRRYRPTSVAEGADCEHRVAEHEATQNETVQDTLKVAVRGYLSRPDKSSPGLLRSGACHGLAPTQRGVKEDWPEMSKS